MPGQKEWDGRRKSVRMSSDYLSQYYLRSDAFLNLWCRKLRYMFLCLYPFSPFMLLLKCKGSSFHHLKHQKMVNKKSKGKWRNWDICGFKLEIQTKFECKHVFKVIEWAHWITRKEGTKWI